jgi:dihydrofolate synthase/folylpolyglutamate synthase
MPYCVPFDVPVLSYVQALHDLHASLKFGIQPLLETVEDMLAECGDPDLCYDCVQVAGTNGKTSTSRYAAAILRGEGLRVALYTSPELVSYTERMEIDGSPVSEEQFAHGMSAALEAGRRVNARRSAAGERPYDITEFDLLTVAAMVVYAEAGVDVAVLEVGMGGRWDATSAAKSVRAVAVTGVGLDHTRILGDTLEAIAGEKAAVIQSGRGCVLGVGTATPESVEQVFLDRCAHEGVNPVLLRPIHLGDAAGEMYPSTPLAHEDMAHASYEVTSRPASLGAPLELDVSTPRATYRSLCALKPAYQAANIACAVALCENFLGRELDLECLRAAVLSCPTPGRFDVLRREPLVLIDACHNPQSVETFLGAIRSMEPEVAKRPALLAAVLADKDVTGIVALLAKEFPRVYVTQTSSPRALAASELGCLFGAKSAEVAGVYATVAEAMAALGEVPYVACGSITLAGEVAALM